MKVILLKQKRGLGKVGEIVTVKDGFGRNFLLPQKLALRATPENEKVIELQKAELEKHNAEISKQEILKTAQLLKNTTIYAVGRGDRKSVV